MDSSRSGGTWTRCTQAMAASRREGDRGGGDTSGDCKELPSSAKPSLVTGGRGGSQESSSSLEQAVRKGQGRTGATVTSMMLLFIRK